jgi:hypothetical protein
VELRDFLYLDEHLVGTFLAQAERGVVKERIERERTSGRGGFGAGIVHTPVTAGFEKSKERSLEIEAVVQQTPESEYNRLYELLEANDLVVIDQADEEAMVGEVRRKQIIEVDARVHVSGLFQLLGVMSTLEELLPVMRAFGTGSDFDESTLTQIRAVLSLSEGRGTQPVIASIPGALGLTVGMELNRRFVKTEEWDVDASVLFRVQRVLRRGESQLVGDPIGGVLKLLPAPKRAELVARMDNPERAAELGVTSPSQIEYPAIVGTPIAIYR